MKKMLAGIGLVGTALFATSAFAADEPRWPNWYVGLHGGIGWYPDSDIEAVGVGSGELKSASGGYGGIALGYLPRTAKGFWSMTRLELEYAYRSNDVEKLGGVNLNTGDTTAQSVMANIFVDFTNDSVFTPYIGGGVGMANVEATANGVSFDDDVFAWQLMAGLAFEPKTMPMTVWSIGYRYFDTTDVDYTAGGVNFEQEYAHHGIEAGAKFRF